jgi:hypothetical protein
MGFFDDDTNRFWAKGLLAMAIIVMAVNRIKLIYRKKRK